MAPTPFREAPVASQLPQEGEGVARYGKATSRPTFLVTSPDFGSPIARHPPDLRIGSAQPPGADTGAVSSDARPATSPPLHPPPTSPTTPRASETFDHSGSDKAALPAALPLRLHPPPSSPSALPRSISAFSRPTPRRLARSSAEPAVPSEIGESTSTFSHPEPRCYPAERELPGSIMSTSRGYPAASSVSLGRTGDEPGGVILPRLTSADSCLGKDTSSGEDASPSGQFALTAILVHPSHYPDLPYTLHPKCPWSPDTHKRLQA